MTIKLVLFVLVMPENWKSRMKPATEAFFISDVKTKKPRPTVEEIFQPTDKLKLFTITQWMGGPHLPIKRSFHRVTVELDELLAGMNVYVHKNDLKPFGRHCGETKHITLLLFKTLNLKQECEKLRQYCLLDTTKPNRLLYLENGNWMTNDYYDPEWAGDQRYFVHLLTYPDVNWKSPKFDIVQKPAEWTEEDIHNERGLEETLGIIDEINPS